MNCHYNFITRRCILLVIGLITFLGVSNTHAQTTLPGMPGLINGPSTAAVGTSSQYTVTAGTNAIGYIWTVTSAAGTIINNGGLVTNVAWNSSFSGSAVVSCTSVNSAGTSTAQTKTITITAAAPIIAGTISTTTPNINSGTQPAITAPAATGGNGVYTYQWQSSPSGATGSWSNITTNGTSQSYTPPTLTATTWYQRNVTSNGTTAPGNAIEINVYPALVPGTITPGSQSALPGGTLTSLSCTNATGGYGTTTYQWQSSPDNGNNNDWVNISGATSTSLPLTSANGTIYYRLAVMNNNQTLYTLPSVVLITDCNQLGTNATSANNYIITNTFRSAGITLATDAQLAAMGVCQVNQEIQYLDGLGRPLQTVMVKASPTQRDIVEPVVYDQYGREVVKYLPYVATAATSDGSYKSTAITDQAAFYNNPSAVNAPGIISIPVVNGVTPAYTPIAYESSPLNRVIEQGAPGTPWQLSTSGIAGSGHTVQMAYGTNASEVTLWEINSNGNGATGTGTYPPGQLYKTTTTDENGNSTYEYKDKQGMVVCKMVQDGSVNLATYYVYDDLNNLTYVIPPIPASTTYPTSFLETDPVFLNFIYGYHYDSRNRLIQKKIPGKGWENMSYNQLDQLVLSQDAVQYNNNQWTVTKYDAQGRVIVTGLWNAGSNIAQTTLQTSIYAGAQWDVRDVANNTGINPTGYVLSSYPTLSKVLTINYYDDYTAPGLPAPYLITSGVSTMTKGLPTATKTAVLNTMTNTTPDMLWKVNYYDDLGRATQTFAQHYLGGILNPNNYDKVVNTYDFANEVIGTTRYHYNSTNTSAPVLTVANSYIYDHEGRKKQTWEQLNGGTNVLLVDDEYNEIGQLMTKNLHGVNPGSASGSDITLGLGDAVASGQSKSVTATNSITLSPGFSAAAGSTFVAQISGYLQTINYAYNERGWLLKINDPSVAPTATSLFSEQLNYNNVAYGALPQFNGNIAEMDYNASSAGRKQVTYSYDPLNRLMAGNSTAGFSETGISYDNMGNLLGLARTVPNAAVLKYSYADANGNSTGNLLQNVTNTNNSQTVKSYQYDVNGNASVDGTNTFTYNMLNLPQTVSSAAFNITYTYDADGTKLRKVSTQTSNGLVSTTDYISGIQYTANSTTIDFIQTEEGRVLNPTTAPNYEYTLTDHLGNNRVTFDMLNGKTSEDDYYPFGLNVQRFSNTNNLYLYNKKELQQELTQYDYGARFYDPVVGRFTTVDPDVENGQESTSPYGYVFDDPIKNTDPDGRDPDDDPPGALSMAGNFVKGLGQSVVGTVTGAYQAIRHPINTIQGIAELNTPGGQAMFAIGVGNTIDKFQNGNGNVKSNMLGNGVGDVAQLFIGTEEIKAVSEALKITKGADEVGEVAKVTEAYKRPNNATTAEQRASVQNKPCATCGETGGKRIADHKKPLVQEHYETGKIDKKRMKDVKSVQPQCATCSAKQGAEMSQYSKEQKKLNGLQ